MLESLCHEANAFVTLTYSDKDLPFCRTPGADGNGAPSLRLKDVQDWLKRLRKRIEPDKIRYFVAGEYSDVGRPHYHAAIFGLRSCAYGQSTYSARRTGCCYFCDLVRDTWGHGNVFLGSLEPSSARYICSYVLKRMTRSDDPRLGGRDPEFARMSLRPGIGRDAMFDVADVLMRHGLDATQVDVPSTLNHAKSGMPLGRYLQRSLRLMVGKSVEVPEEVCLQRAQEMLALRLSARASSEYPSVGRQVEVKNRQARLSAKARRKIFQSRGKL